MSPETWCDELSAAAGVGLIASGDWWRFEMISPCGARLVGGSINSGYGYLRAERRPGTQSITLGATITLGAMGSAIDPRALGHALRAWIDSGDILPLCALWMGGEP